MLTLFIFSHASFFSHKITFNTFFLLKKHLNTLFWPIYHLSEKNSVINIKKLDPDTKINQEKVYFEKLKEILNPTDFFEFFKF